MSTNTPKPLPFEISGKKLGLTALQVKGKEHFWWTFTTSGKPAPYGEPIPALAADLPKFVVVDGHKVDLAPGLTGKDGESGRRAKVSYSGPVDFGGDIGVKNLSVSVSVRKDEGWNVVAKVTGQGGGSVSPETAKARQDANLAKLEALFAA